MKITLSFCLCHYKVESRMVDSRFSVTPEPLHASDSRDSLLSPERNAGV